MIYAITGTIIAKAIASFSSNESLPVSDMAYPPIAPQAPSVIFLYGMSLLGVLGLLASLYLFYKIGRLEGHDRVKIKRLFLGALLLFLVSSLVLAFFSYMAGQFNIPFVGHPGFDPRVT